MWAIVEEYYLLKQEQGGEGGGLGKRRHTGDQEDFVDVKRQRFVDPEDGRDRYDKAERYNQADLERVQRIPKKEEEGGDGEAKVKVEAPSAEKIREMMAATQKAIEDRKKKLKLVPVPQVRIKIDAVKKKCRREPERWERRHNSWLRSRLPSPAS